MKKKDRVKSNILFNDIINKGSRVSNKYYVLCHEQSEDNNKYGIAVGKKVGNAVVRNKIKRQVRHIIDKNKEMFPKRNNYIIICKKEVLKLSFREMESELIMLIQKGEQHEK